MHWQKGLLLSSSEFDDVRVSNRCSAEINDATLNVSKGSNAACQTKHDGALFQLVSSAPVR